MSTSGKRLRRNFFIAFTLIAIVVILCLVNVIGSGSFAPMFYRRDGPLWTLSPVLPFVDRKGNYGYSDPELNVFVVVATKDPEVWQVDLPLATSSRARLLAGSRYETIVGTTRDRLIIICPNGPRIEVALDPGTVRAWRSRLIEIYKDGFPNLIGELVALYRGPEARRLKEFVSKNALLQEVKGQGEAHDGGRAPEGKTP
jgi:hypothetical protein